MKEAQNQPDDWLEKNLLDILPEDDVKYAAARVDSPEGFARYFEIMQGFPLHKEGEKWVKNIYEARRQGKGLAQEAFRGSGKTTVFSKMFFSFRIGLEPHTSNIIIRINDTKAKETVSAVASIIQYDDNWKKIFPHVVPDIEKGWSLKGYFVKRTDMQYEEWTSLRTRGTQDPTFTGYGWDSGSVIGSRCNGVMIVDDIHDRDNTASDRQMAAVKNFVVETLEYVKMPEAWEIWNFTPWRENDVYAFIKSTGEYLISRSPGMWEDEDGEVWPKDPRIPISGKKWKLAWPEMFGFEELSKKYKKSGHIAFARMILLNLDATKGQTLKREWLHEYPTEDINPSWPAVFGIDYASTADKLKNKDADYFSLAIGRLMPGGGCVLVDGYRAKVTKGEAMEKVASYAALYPNLHSVGVETHGTGLEFYQDLMLVRDMAGKMLPLRQVKHGKQNKGYRFEEWLAPHFQMNRVWIADAFTPFMHAFVDEWLLYPSAEHDDTIDSVYMMVKPVETRLLGPKTLTDNAKSLTWPYNREGDESKHPYSKLGSYRG